MPSPPRSSPGSAPCRLEWRPSRWQCGAQLLVAALAPWALCSSDLPAELHWPASLLALMLGGGQAWRYRRTPAQRIVILPGEASARVDGQTVEDLQLSDRGVLLQLAWRRQGRRHWRLFWPDTLPPALRRELRLAVRAHCISRSRPAVAP
jgi:toxin CptA